MIFLIMQRNPIDTWPHSTHEKLSSKSFTAAILPLFKTTCYFYHQNHFMTELEKYRDHIDQIDKELIDLLAGRFIYSARIGDIKREKGISVLQSGRWDDILASRKEYAIQAGLSEKFTMEFLQLVHRESIRIQNEITGSRDITS